MELIVWRHLSGGYGDAGMRPERRLSGRNRSGRRAPFPSFLRFWRESDKSQGFADGVPIQRTSSFCGLQLGEWSTTKALTSLKICHFTPRSPLQ